MESWLAHSYKQLLEEDDFTDCCVVVGTRRFPCHKVILGVASEFFKRTFQPGFAEAKTGDVTLTDVTEDIFEKFRLYAYSYDRTLLNSYSNQDMITLKECANMWISEPLKKACEEIFRERLPRMEYSDLLLYFEHAHHIHDTKLIREISSNLKRNISCNTIPETLYELGSDVFREFLKVIENSSTEKTRYDIIEKYVAIHGFVLNQSDLNKWEFHGLANPNDKIPDTVFRFGELSINDDKKTDEYANPNPFKVEKLNFSDPNSICLDPRSKKVNSEYVKTVLSLIDYTKMTAKEFFEGPGKSKMMTFEEKFNFMYKIATEGTPVIRSLFALPIN
ncbi:kelch-like protein 40 [Drosophila takahashii]|uniref:kelch-like protein 40 n=1 Tax=Drosophila takahashii TaxID=29030 RepID=UPI001CF8699C|nr:kelch-like protein 40 [Drosophila takahashii]